MSKIEFDPRFWHNIQGPFEMDVSRRFEYDEDSLELIRRWLRLHDSQVEVIVEVGSGSGYFTEKLVEMTHGQAKIVCVEPDDVLRRYAETKLAGKAEFLSGYVEDLPLPSDYADLTVCHILLHNLPDIYKAVREMVRVTRKGGIVAAIEPAIGSFHYYPDETLNKLIEKVQKAFGKSVWELRTKLMKYPREKPWIYKPAYYVKVFHECGLTEIEIHGILSVFLLSDPRRSRNQIIEWLKDRLKVLKETEKQDYVILKRGGLSKQEITRYRQKYRQYLEKLIKKPELISETHEMEITSRILILGLKRE
jgi:ubiquinone/menaquinone biosynthesis C-methylase UbiE